MIGSPSNKQVLADSGLLADEGRSAGADDLVIALRAAGEEAGRDALAYAERLLVRPQAEADETGTWRPKTLASAAEALAGANLALISVPGEFAADEARKALKSGLHVMLFSDNVSLDDERALKEEAREQGRLLMGPRLRHRRDRWHPTRVRQRAAAWRRRLRIRFGNRVAGGQLPDRP